MKNNSLKVQGYKADDIKKLLSSNEAFIVGMRLYIVYKVALGYSSRKLAELHGVSFKQITNWVHRFEKEGIDGLADKKGRGRKASLNDGQLEQLKKLILTESPQKHGYNGEKWTGPTITTWIERTFRVGYKEAQVYNLLDKIGINFVKGKGFIEE